MEKRLIDIGLGILIFSILSFGLSAKAEVFYVPEICPAVDLKIHLTNHTNEELAYWIEIPRGFETEEHALLIPPLREVDLRLAEYSDQIQGFRIKTLTAGLSMQVSCSTLPPMNLDTLSAKQVVFHSSPAKYYQIYLMNLFPSSQQVEILGYSSLGEEVYHNKVSFTQYYATQTFTIENKTEIDLIVVKAEARMSAALFDKEAGHWLPKLIPPIRVDVDPTEKYFLVAHRSASRMESFIVSTKDFQMIELLEKQIQTPSLEKIVFAHTRVDKNSYNRNMLERNSSPYSWRVDHIETLGDFGPIFCNGSPDIFEEHILEKMNEGGYICFWSFRVLRKLSPSEIISGS